MLYLWWILYKIKTMIVIIREGNGDKKTKVQLGYVCCLSCLDNIASTPMKNPPKTNMSPENSGWKTFAFPFEMAPFWGKFVHFRGLYPVSKKHKWREGIGIETSICHISLFWMEWIGFTLGNFENHREFPELLGRWKFAWHHFFNNSCPWHRPRSDVTKHSNFHTPSEPTSSYLTLGIQSPSENGKGT